SAEAIAPKVWPVCDVESRGKRADATFVSAFFNPCTIRRTSSVDSILAMRKSCEPNDCINAPESVPGAVMVYKRPFRTKAPSTYSLSDATIIVGCAEATHNADAPCAQESEERDAPVSGSPAERKRVIQPSNAGRGTMVTWTTILRESFFGTS